MCTCLMCLSKSLGDSSKISVKESMIIINAGITTVHRSPYLENWETAKKLQIKQLCIQVPLFSIYQKIKFSC